MFQNLTPQRKQAIIFFMAMVLLSIGVLLWTFRWNRGTLQLIGEPPFTVSLGSIKNFPCLESPCEFLLSPRRYFIHASKDQYFDFSGEATVKRWRKQGLPLAFTFRPKIQTLGEFLLPEKLERIPAFTGSPFHAYDELDLAKIPSDTQSVLFAPSGRAALLTLGKETYHYQHRIGTETAELNRLALPPSNAMTFGANEHTIFLLQNPSEGSQTLFQINIKNLAKPVQEKLTSFERPLARAKIFPSPNDHFLLIQERGSVGNSKFYLLNTQAKTKERLNLPEAATNIRWVHNSWLTYHLRENDVLKVSLFSVETKQEKPLEALSADTVTAKEGSRILFVSQRSFEESGGVPRSEINVDEEVDEENESVDIGKSLQEDIMLLFNPQRKWFFVDYDLLGNEASKLVAEFTYAEGEMFGETEERLRDGILWFSTKRDGKQINHQLILSQRK